MFFGKLPKVMLLRELNNHRVISFPVKKNKIMVIKVKLSINMFLFGVRWSFSWPIWCSLEFYDRPEFAVVVFPIVSHYFQLQPLNLDRTLQINCTVK
jgi:hypothetical protein